MMEKKPSAWLLDQRDILAEAVRILAARFGYASVLATDDRGISFSATPGETRTAEPMWVQRGFVFRAQDLRAGRGAGSGARTGAAAGPVAEYACDVLPGEGSAAKLADAAGARLAVLFDSMGPDAITYPPIPDEPLVAEYAGRVEVDARSADPEAVMARLAALRDSMRDGKVVAMAQSRAGFMDVSRMFISPNRSLAQGFAWAEAYIFGVARRGHDSKMSYRSVSGRKGLEILDELEGRFPALRDELSTILDAIRIEPGEYDVILDPDVAGTLAHESFGHGVETDMFFRRRALAASYLGKRVGSDLVNMYDGAAGVDHTGSFLFDDEGNSATKTKVIDRGIFLGGISDSLSALALGMPRTGNGRRQAFSHKAYARMTNTYFEPGESSLDEMLATVKKGWLITRLSSGMEDPRNWGIQLVCMVGKEIADGRLTGRVASPVILSGYVPDVLGAVSMVSGDFALAGSGACGKGHKEYVKVSSGGPYVKTRMRLG